MFPVLCILYEIYCIRTHKHISRFGGVEIRRITEDNKVYKQFNKDFVEFNISAMF